MTVEGKRNNEQKEKNRNYTNKANSYIVTSIVSMVKPIMRFTRSVLQYSTSVFYLLIVLLIFACAFLIGWETFRDREVFISEILVPEELAEIGYTASVIGKRLKDSFTCYYSDDDRFGRDDSTTVFEVNVALASSEQDIVVPTIGVSVNAIASYFRGIFQSDDHIISGEVLFHQLENKVFLRLRENGEQIYDNSRQFGDEGMADLIKEGAYALAVAVDPHVVASFLIRNREEKSAEKLVMGILANHMDTETYVQGVILKGTIHLSRGEYDESISEFERATALNPEFARAYNNWGVALVRNNELNEAKQKYELAIENDRQLAAAHINLGALHVRLKEFDQAITQFRKAVEINPQDARTYNNWGISLLRRAKSGDRSNAIQKFRRALELDPNYSGAYAGWAEALDHEYNAERAAVVRNKADRPIQIEEAYMRTCHNL